MSLTTTLNSTDIKVISVADFFKSLNIVSVVGVVRENTNKYPYVTLMDKDNVAHNTYFSKGASEALAAGEPIAKGFFSKYNVAETTNAAGEIRMKFVRADAGNRISIDDLLD